MVALGEKNIVARGLHRKIMTNFSVWRKVNAFPLSGVPQTEPTPQKAGGTNAWSCGTGTYMSHLRLNVVVLIKQGNTTRSHFVRLQSNVLNLAWRKIQGGF